MPLIRIFAGLSNLRHRFLQNVTISARPARRQILLFPARGLWSVSESRLSQELADPMSSLLGSQRLEAGFLPAVGRAQWPPSHPDYTRLRTFLSISA